MLYRSTDCLCRRGAPMKNLAHSASFDSEDKDAPIKAWDQTSSCCFMRTPLHAECRASLQEPGMQRLLFLEAEPHSDPFLGTGLHK